MKFLALKDVSLSLLQQKVKICFNSISRNKVYSAMRIEIDGMSKLLTEICIMEKRETIGWIDLLRILACFLVVFSHCCDPFTAQFDTSRI